MHFFSFTVTTMTEPSSTWSHWWCSENAANNICIFTYLAALTRSGFVTISIPHSLVDESSWQRGVGSRTHHDLRRTPHAASHFTIGTSGPWRPWYTHSFELNPFCSHSSLVQHVACFCRNSWDTHHSLSTWAWVWLFPEFDFFPEGNEKYEEKNDDKGKDPDANYLSWSDIRQRLSLRNEKKILKNLDTASPVQKVRRLAHTITAWWKHTV